MEIGIVAEGHADQFVIRNILYSFDIEKDNIRFLRPELASDETEINGKKQKERDNEDNARDFGSWTNVKNDCESKFPFRHFFENPLEEERIMIIQLDTDTCSQYDVQEVFNPKTFADFQEMRNRVIQKVDEWLGNDYIGKLLYAICIRQMDAWVLTLYATQNEKDTGLIAMPKNELNSLKAYKSVKSYRQIRKRYEILSGDFSNKKKLKKAIEYNQSLKDFVESVAITTATTS
ncbi:MAG: hypothetical protein MUE81_09440 [Thermoflexibacter sp.]|jgi:hypothetical protein|nr:hypothetical protein [Thermoflexibacter sp.]